jgi:hypothetical protein
VIIFPKQEELSQFFLLRKYEQERVMGNHAIGRQAMAVASALAEYREQIGLSALEILDKSCECCRGYDAEFEWDDEGGEVFHALLVEAFRPEYDPDIDLDGDEFYDMIYKPFTRRYGIR